MKLITDNPYRTLGILVGTTLREQNRQINKIKMFIEAEQEIDFDEYSFPTLGKLKRNLDTIEFSENQLNLDSDKLEAAIFWFYDGYTTDIPAFDCIKENDLESALTIWQDLIAKSDSISQRSASAYNNLSTLFLSEVLEGVNTNGTILEQGISLKIKFLESEYINDFIILATAENYKATKKEIQLLFLNQLLFEIEKSGTISLNTLLDVLIKLDFSAKEDFLNDFVKKPIEIITRKIEESKSKRKVDKTNTANIGKALFEGTTENFKQLKSILGTKNIRFSNIADKVSDEILQCGIDYFLHYKDSSIEPSSASMELFLIAKSLAIGNIAKQRCEENTDILQKWIRDKPEREKQKQLENDLKSLLEIVKEYQNLNSGNINTARSFLNRVDNKYKNLIAGLGVNNQNSILISDRIIEIAWKFTKYEIELQFKFFKDNGGVNSKKAVKILLGTINNSISFINDLINYSISSNLNRVLTREHTDLVQFRDKIKNVKPSGCYIATMAYGDYDHPQVLQLRKFRDEILDKSTFGRWFVKTYYHYSPKLVERLKNQRTVNVLIRKVLDQFIKLIK